MIEEQPQVNVDKNLMEVQCAVCNLDLKFVVPTLQVFNGQQSSVLVWSHERPQSCTRCGTAYQMMFQGFQGVAIAWMPLQKQPERNIIVAPGNDSKLKVMG